MLHMLSTSLPDYIVLLFASFLISIGINKLIMHSNSQRWSFLYIPADKSPTNARLLGGLSILCSSLIVMIIFYQLNRSGLIRSEKDLLKASFLSTLILGFAGYIDDKLEIRARYKLMAQFAAIALLSFSQFDKDSSSSFIFTMFNFILGMALVNGSNLLDGLDSMSTKIGITTQLAFLTLALHSGNAILIFSSLCLMTALLGFYFFGKEPAKIYMGEIGGAYLGLIMFVQFNLVIVHSKVTMASNNFESFFIAFLIISYPIFELAISFGRRILMKKSPFRGDKLHLHYIIKNKFNLSPSKTSNFLALYMVFFIIFGLFLVKSFSIFTSTLIFSITICASYSMACYSEWIKTMHKIKMSNIFLYFEDKPVYVIDSDLFKKMDLKILTEKSQQKKIKAAA